MARNSLFCADPGMVIDPSQVTYRRNITLFMIGPNRIALKVEWHKAPPSILDAKPNSSIFA
jgi:hypothetical protein